ncbi:hypothetical protein MesoLj131a_58660 [Mesorhizobium sp. 131-2-1]|nr:hypothetical protein MesoLj131a_58660 [Mesorhizobium sp. 131-2-1]
MVALAVVERGQKLAFRQVAGAAENDEVERIDGDDLAGHGLSALTPRSGARLIYSNRFKFSSAMVSHVRIKRWISIGSMCALDTDATRRLVGKWWFRGAFAGAA